MFRRAFLKTRYNSKLITRQLPGEVHANSSNIPGEPRMRTVGWRSLPWAMPEKSSTVFLIFYDWVNADYLKQ